MEKMTNAMEIVKDENEGYNDYDLAEYSGDSDESELDLTKILMWAGIGAAAIGGIVLANKDRIKEARRKRKEKKMRKYAEQLGYDIVDPDDYAEYDYEDDVEEDCESDEE